jgi:hypothetical protein
MDDKDLLARLYEDTESPEEAAELFPVVQKLQEWKAPIPTAQEINRLARSLQQSLSVRRNNTISHRLHLGWLVLCSQLRVVQYEIWAASAIVMGLGILVTLVYSLSTPADSTLPLVSIAPIVAAAGISFLYGPMVDQALEIEMSLPISPRQVMVARLVLVFGFNLILGLTGSAILSTFRTGISFLPLVSAWLAPMTFLASLAFLMITLTLDSGLSLLVCLGLWIVQNLTHLIPGIHLPFLIPDLTAAPIRPWLWLLTLLLSGMALWLGGNEEHWLRKLA